MAEKDRIEISIEAIDKTSAVLRQINELLGNLTQQLQNTINSVNGLNQQFEKLNTSVQPVLSSLQSLAKVLDDVSQKAQNVKINIQIKGNVEEASKSIKQTQEIAQKQIEEIKQTSDRIQDVVEQKQGEMSAILGKSQIVAIKGFSFKPTDLSQLTNAYKDYLNRVRQIRDEEIGKLIEEQEKISQNLTPKAEQTAQATETIFLQQLIKPLSGNLTEMSRIVQKNFETVFESISGIKEKGLDDETIARLEQFGTQLERYSDILGSSGLIPTKLQRTLARTGRELWQNAMSLRNSKDLFLDYDDIIEEVNGHFNNLNITLGEVNRRIEREQKQAVREARREWIELGRGLGNIGFGLLMLTGSLSLSIKKTLESFGRYGLESKWYSLRMGLPTQDIQAFNLMAQYTNTTLQQLATAAAVLSRKLFDAGYGSGVATRAIKVLGLNLYDAQGNFKSAGELIAEIMVKVQKMAKDLVGQEGSLSMAISAIMTKLFGRENTRQMMFLMQSLDDLRQRYSKGITLGVILSDEDQKKAEEFQEAIITLKNAIIGLGYAFATTVAPLLLPFIKGITNLIVWIKELIKHSGIVGNVLSFLITVGSILTATLGSLAIAVRFLVVGITYLNGSLAVLKGILTTLIASKGGIIGLIIGAGALIASLVGMFKSPFKTIQKEVYEFKENFINIFKKLVDEGYGAGYDFMKAYMEGMQNGSWMLKRYAYQLAQEIFELFGGGHSPAKVGPLSNLEYWGADLIKAYVEGIKQELPRQKEEIERSIDEIQKVAVSNNDFGVNETIQKIGENIKKAWQNYIDNLQKWLENRTLKLGYDLGASLGRALTGQGSFISVGAVLINYMKDVVSQIRDATINFLGSVQNTLTSGIDKIVNQIQKGIARDIMSTFNIAPNSFWGQFIQGFMDNSIFKVIGDWFKYGVNILFDTAKSSINLLAGSLLNFLNQLTPPTIAQIKTTFDKITQAMQRYATIEYYASIFRAIFSVPQYAEGGITNKPHMAVVGEEGAEAIIPLSPNKRRRGLELWMLAGRYLGIPFFAEGGVAGQTPNVVDWAIYLAKVMSGPFERLNEGLANAIARWENASIELSKSIKLERDFRQKEQVKLLDTIRAVSINTNLINTALMRTIEYLKAISSASSETNKTLNKPLTVDKILQTVITDDINLKSPFIEFAKNYYVQQFAKKVNRKDLEIESIKKMKDTEILALAQSINAKGLTDALKQNYEVLKVYFPDLEAQEKVLEVLQKIGDAKKSEGSAGKLREILTNEINLRYLRELWDTVKLLETRYPPEKYGAKTQETKVKLEGNFSLQRQDISLEDRKILEPFLPLLGSFMPLSKKLASEWKSIADYFTQLTNKQSSNKGKAPDLATLRNNVNNLINEYNKTAKDYAEGRITYSEYIQNLTNLNKQLEDQSQALQSANENITKPLSGLLSYKANLTMYATKLQDALKTGNIEESLVKNINALLGKDYKLPTDIKQQEEFIRNLADVINEEISQTDKLIEAINKGQQITQENTTALQNLKENINEVLNEIFVRAKSTLYESLGAFIQGDFVNSFKGIINFVKEGIYKGMLDAFTKNANFNKIAQGLQDLYELFLRLPTQKNPDYFATFKQAGEHIISIFKGFMGLNEGFFKNFGSFLIYSTKAYENLRGLIGKGTKTTAQTLFGEDAVEYLKGVFTTLGDYYNKASNWFETYFPTLAGILTPFRNILQPEKIVKAFGEFLQLSFDDMLKTLGITFKRIISGEEATKEDFKYLEGKNILKSFLQDLIKGLKSITPAGLIKDLEKSPLTKWAVEPIKQFVKNAMDTPIMKFTADSVKSVFNTFKTVFGNVFQALSPMKDAFASLLGSIFGGPIGSILATLGLDALEQVLGDFMGMLQDITNGFLKEIVSIFKDVLRPIMRPLIQYFATVLKIILDLLRPFVPFLQIIAEFMGQFIIPIFTWLATFIGGILKPILYVFGKALAWLIRGLGQVIDTLFWWITDFGRKMMDAADAMNKALDEMVQTPNEPANVNTEEQKKDSPISIANLSGTALDEFKKLLSPLQALTRLDGYFQDMLAYLKRIADSFTVATPDTYIPYTKPTQSSTLEKSVVINNLNVYVDQVADAQDVKKLVDTVLKEAGVQVKSYKYVRG